MLKIHRDVLEKIVLFTILLNFTFCPRAFAQTSVKDGIHREYYEGGKLKSEANFKDGKKDGIGKIFDENGKLLQTVQYEKGKVIKVTVNEAKRDWGPLKLLKDFRLWAVVIVLGALLWLVFVKFMLKGRV